MKRDDDLIRLLMLDLEETSTPITQSHTVSGYNRDQVAYHLAIIVKQGLAEGPSPMYSSSGQSSTIPMAVVALRLTPAGHDFIASIRDDSIWAKVKEKSVAVSGGLTLRVIKELAVAIAKTHLGLP